MLSHRSCWVSEISNHPPPSGTCSLLQTRYHNHQVASFSGNSRKKTSNTPTSACHIDAVITTSQMAHNALNTDAQHHHLNKSSDLLVNTSSSVSPPSSLPSSIPPCLTTVRIRISAGTVALVLLFISATFHSLAKYFYSYYRLIFGTLYPAYASYKAIKNKNIKEYVSLFLFLSFFVVFFNRNWDHSSTDHILSSPLSVWVKDDESIVECEMSCRMQASFHPPGQLGSFENHLLPPLLLLVSMSE